jgi:sulfide:quinone oxidoreductase
MADERTRVVIAGGGVAGIEALLALRDLAGDRVDVTLVAPTPEFVYKPMTVQAPFTSESAIRLELAPLVAERGGMFIQKGLRHIDVERHTADLDDGSTLDFDAAIICVGAKPRVAFGHAATLRTSGEPLDIDGLLRQAAEHESARIAFVVPPTGSWPLPVYELALMAERRARELSVEVAIMIVTPEPEPLGVFGHIASDAIAQLLAVRGIAVRAGARAREGMDGTIVLDPGDEHLDVGAVVSLPELHGPAPSGLPADDRGFIPIGEHAEVLGAPGIYAAGDGTNFPIKHGGIGTQQADAAAEDIAARAGAPIDPAPFRPVIRGRLIAGDEYVNLQADIAGGGGEGAVSYDYLWWPPQKIAGNRVDRPYARGSRPAARARHRRRAVARSRLAPRPDGARPQPVNLPLRRKRHGDREVDRDREQVLDHGGQRT